MFVEVFLSAVVIILAITSLHRVYKIFCELYQFKKYKGKYALCAIDRDFKTNKPKGLKYISLYKMSELAYGTLGSNTLLFDTEIDALVALLSKETMMSQVFVVRV